MTYANATERQALISGLRELAGFLEENPEVPAPKYADLLVFPLHVDSDAGQRSEIDVIASLIGSATEISSHHRHHRHYTTSRRFGPVEYRAVAISSDQNKEHEQ